MAHDLEKEPEQYQEEEVHIDMVNVNSEKFNRKHSVITAN